MDRPAPYPYADPRAPPSDYRRRVYDGDVSAKDMSHEERREREKPTRTLFIRNIPYEANQTEVNDIFASYGKLARFYNLITKRGMAFVTYYDLRDADRAKRALQGHAIMGRPINIHYSLPRDDDPVAENADDPTKAPSSIFVLVREATEEVSNDDVKDLFSQWGDVKEVRDGKGKTVTTKFVDFWDTRDAEKACEAATGMKIKGGTIEARYALQTGRKPTGTLSSMKHDRHGAPDPYRDAYDPYDRRDFGPYAGGNGSNYGGNGGYGGGSYGGAPPPVAAYNGVGGGGSSPPSVSSSHYDAYRGYAPSSSSSAPPYDRRDPYYPPPTAAPTSSSSSGYPPPNSYPNYGAPPPPNGAYGPPSSSYPPGNAYSSSSYGPPPQNGSYGPPPPSSYPASSSATPYGPPPSSSSYPPPSSSSYPPPSSSSYPPPSSSSSSYPPPSEDQAILQQISQLQSMLNQSRSGPGGGGGGSSGGNGNGGAPSSSSSAPLPPSSSSSGPPPPHYGYNPGPPPRY